ncbi:hypothetical protein OH491_21620 [Termitidicoccus mucosus]|uniref:hypothetical protein n=1 Tax=Termitidicoccus mucosus TaxID=1184151 RepID=UPI003182BA77
MVVLVEFRAEVVVAGTLGVGISVAEREIGAAQEIVVVEIEAVGERVLVAVGVAVALDALITEGLADGGLEAELVGEIQAAVEVLGRDAVVGEVVDVGAFAVAKGEGPVDARADGGGQGDAEIGGEVLGVILVVFLIAHHRDAGIGRDLAAAGLAEVLEHRLDGDVGVGIVVDGAEKIGIVADCAGGLKKQGASRDFGESEKAGSEAGGDGKGQYEGRDGRDADSEIHCECCYYYTLCAVAIDWRCNASIVET